MRFDTPIYFVVETPGKYNAATGDYGTSSTEETVRYANVTDTGAETIQLVYGHMEQGVLTLRIQDKIYGSYSYIRIGDKKYRADMIRTLRREQVFVVREIQWAVSSSTSS